MMATLGVHSRRKQAKPQRLPDKDGVIRGDDDMATTMTEDVAYEGMDIDVQNESASPIDLSTKKGSIFSGGDSKSILEDKSNILFDSLGINTPQQLLNLYAQLSRANEMASSESPEDQGGFEDEASGDYDSPAPSSTPASRPAAEQHQCPAENCGELLSSAANLLWHVQDTHPDEPLIQCNRCSDKFDSRQGLPSHKCRTVRASSVKESDDLDDDDGRASAPARVFCDFSVVLPKSPTLAPSSLSFLNSLFPQQKNGISSESAPLDLTSTPPNHPHLFPNLPGFPPGFPHPMAGLPPPHFMMRPPFPGEMFPPRDMMSNEDDWESLMEVSNTDESEKIRALVGDKAMPVTDPNQCILCRRVLSCKSALQMHYRTHTGERPFKCKICQRAFTTKGNLKTHMGVHRAKHAFRGVGMSSPMISPAQQCPICQKRFLNGPQLQAHIAEHTQQLRNPVLNATLNRENPHKPPGIPQPPQLPNGFYRLPPGFPMFPFPFPPGFPQPPPPMMNHSTPQTPSSEAATPSIPPPFNLAQMLGLDKAPMAMVSSPSPSRESLETKEPTSAPQQNTAFSISATVNIVPTENPILSALSESLALRLDEDRRSGSLLLESKIEKLDAQKSLIDSISPSSSSHASSHDHSHDQTDGSSVGRADSEPEEKKPRLSAELLDRTPIKPELIDMPKIDLSESAKKRISENPLDAMQKMWSESIQTEAAPPRQMPVLSKHQCAVCFKHFSSSSALQIHMRTHTGDKPFKCEVCSRAFTTRGNLKVHMGTHMWQQSPSRRGRRIFDAAPGMEPRRLFESDSGPSPVPSLAGLPGLPGFPGPFPLFPPGPPNVDMMMMLMRTVCSVCQKVCSSPIELEQHLKAHLTGTLGMSTPPMSETRESSPPAI